MPTADPASRIPESKPNLPSGWNGIAVIICDVLSTVCLGVLMLGTLNGQLIALPLPIALGLFVIGKTANTILSYLQPVHGNRVW